MNYANLLAACRLLKASRFQLLEPDGIQPPQPETFNPTRDEPVDLSHHVAPKHRAGGWRMRGHYGRDGSAVVANVELYRPRVRESWPDKRLAAAAMYWYPRRKGFRKETEYEPGKPAVWSGVPSTELLSPADQVAYDAYGQHGADEEERAIAQARASGNGQGIVDAIDARAALLNTPERTAEGKAWSQRHLDAVSSPSGRARRRDLDKAAESYLNLGLKHMTDRFNPAVHGSIEMSQEAPDEGRFPNLETTERISPPEPEQLELPLDRGKSRFNQLDLD